MKRIHAPENPAPIAFGLLFFVIVAVMVYWAKSPIPPVVSPEIMAKATHR